MPSDCDVAPPPYNNTGYAIRNVWIDGKRTTRGAHRLAWEAENGSITDDRHVLHHCDSPPCVNLEHLYLGTPKDNMNDQLERGRHANQRKTHCANCGADLSDPELVYVDPSGSRKCRPCRRQTDLRRRRKD